MKDYIIYTDSACDIAPALLSEWGVQFSSLSFHFEGEKEEYSNNDMNILTFYDKMRAGGIAKTSAVNMQMFEEAFEKILLQDLDILYIGFSSGLSATYRSAQLAAEGLREKYPNNKIRTVDSLSGSSGQALLLYLVLQKKQSGVSIDEAAEYAEKIKNNISLWVTVDDLVYLKRGGRISATSAAIGSMLGIKPIIHVNEEGKLISMSKVRGRKRSVLTLADKYGELAKDKSKGTLFISHSDCKNDVEELASILKERYHISVELIMDIGPVIGAHTGPGAIAFAFVGTQK